LSKCSHDIDWVIRLKGKLVDSKNEDNQPLSLPQSFLLGLVSKFISTLVTYPLIRAKVKREREREMNILPNLAIYLFYKLILSGDSDGSDQTQ